MNKERLIINAQGYPAMWDEVLNPLDTLVSVFALKGFYLKDGVKRSAVGIYNKGVMAHLTVRKIIDMVRSDLFKARTLNLRSISLDTPQGKKASRSAKEQQFSYATFSGTFSYANDESLLTHSGLICIDLDGLDDPQAIRLLVQQQDGYVFSFVSPRGKGLKVIFLIDPAAYSQEKWYKGISRLLEARCGIPSGKFDESCKNVSRACFLSYDPTVHVNPDLG